MTIVSGSYGSQLAALRMQPPILVMPLLAYRLPPRHDRRMALPTMFRSGHAGQSSGSLGLENFLGAARDAWCLSVRKLARAILSHRFVTGTGIQGDGGLMFTLAVVRRVASFAVIGVRRPDSHPRA
ncbi:MAG: hypothetical protein IPK67_14420 [Planctomycetes bacterium]|nr:hypothetical protein [Planctomycetota bacterium]